MTSWFTPREAARDRGLQITQSLAVIAGLGFSIYVGRQVATDPGQLALPAMLLAGALFLVRVEWAIYALPIAVAVARGEILPLGLNPTQLLLGASAAGLALRWATGRFRQQQLDPLAVPLGVLVLWPVLLFVTGFSYTVHAAQQVVGPGPALLAFLLGRYVIQTDNQVRRLTTAIVVGGFVLLAGLGWFFFTDPRALDLVRQQQFLRLRSSDLSPFFGSGIWFGLLVPPLSVASVWLLQENRLRRLMAFSLILGVAGLSSLTNTRVGWPLIAFAFIFAILGLPGHGRDRWRKIAVVGLVTLLIIGFVLGQFLGAALASMWDRLGELGDPERLLNRVPSWVSTLTAAAQRPLFGWGPGFINSHTLFLSFAGAYGFPYALVWIVVMGVVLKRAWRLTRCESNASTGDALVAFWVGMALGFVLSLALATFLGDPMFTTIYWLIAGAVSHQYAKLIGGNINMDGTVDG